jgi:2-iminoacetate synthase ThiH
MGNVTMTPEEFEAMLDRAAKRGARAALEELGLHDKNAEKDLGELRSLLSAWRETRTTVWQTAVRIITGGVLMFVAAAVWMSVKDNVGQ